MRGDYIEVGVEVRPIGFNPRPRMRGDDQRPSVVPVPFLCFNPRPRMRGDFTVLLPCILAATFQSTPPHEGRPSLDKLCLFASAFQSTPPHEGRQYHAQTLMVLGAKDLFPQTYKYYTIFELLKQRKTGQAFI